MFQLPASAASRRWTAALALALAAAPPLLRADQAAGPDLELGDAAALAVTAQPLLDSVAARQRAAGVAAVAARQLPDPRLNLRLQDLPIDTDDAYSLTRDSDTQLVVGIAQEFPRAEKRRLRGERFDHQARSLGAEQALLRLGIRRDAALAWLALWRYTQERDLIAAALEQAQTQLALAEIGLRNGTTTQARFLAARQAQDALADELRGAEQGIEHARSGLFRWIGDAALRPVQAALPEWPALPSLAQVSARLGAHPQLAVDRIGIAQGETGAQLARAAYRPDWRLQVGYGHRPAFSEMVMVEVGVDLPVFSRNRQDRDLEAALAQQDAAESALDDSTRQLDAAARLAHHDAERLTERLREYDARLLPDGAARTEAALAGWRAGRSTLGEVIDARQADIDIRRRHLDLQRDLARSYIQLTYLGAWVPAAGRGDSNHE